MGQTQVFDHGITPEEVLEQLNKIISPWKVEFASPMSWFAVWRGKQTPSPTRFFLSFSGLSHRLITIAVNERVARYYSSPDQRVFIGGDAA